MEKKCLKISVRKGRFISSLFPVYFSVVSWFYVNHFQIQNWPKYSESISNWLLGLEIAVYLNILLIHYLRKVEVEFLYCIENSNIADFFMFAKGFDFRASLYSKWRNKS